jgi:hypothetical protein
MSKGLTIVLVIVAIFFVIGMIAGNYHCTTHLCNTVTSAVSLVSDIVKTEAKGITWVFGNIARFVG